MLTLAQRLPALRMSLPARHLPGTALLAVTVLLYLFAGLSLASVDVLDGRADARAILPGSSVFAAPLPKGPPPAPEPLAFRDMSPVDAATYNASVPFSAEPNPAARPFRFAAATDVDKLRAEDCLTAAIYYEAGIESSDGQRAVAQVVLNRVRHPAFPKTVCGVVFQGSERSTGCQFTFTCDGALARIPNEAGWERARKIAEEALAGKVYKPVGYATHYHTNWVVPYWSGSLTKLAQVGAHIFYRWEGGWGRPPAFRFSAVGVEPQIALMNKLSSVPADLADQTIDATLVVADGQQLPIVTPPDMVGRAVVRRYEPLREEAAASVKANLAKTEVPQSLRWALTGDSSGGSQKSLGSQSTSPSPAATAPASAAPSAGDTAGPTR